MVVGDRSAGVIISQNDFRAQTTTWLAWYSQKKKTVSAREEISCLFKSRLSPEGNATLHQIITLHNRHRVSYM